MKLLLSFAFVLFSFLTLPAAAASAATYYVATNGNDTNAGTQASPWKTIQKGANTANSGDTVEVGAGTYYERLTLNKTGITFVGWEIEKVLLMAVPQPPAGRVMAMGCGRPRASATPMP